MNIKITARTDVSDDLREYAEDKVLRLKKYLDRIHSTEIRITPEGDHTRIELVINAVRGNTFVADARDESATAAVDMVTEKMEKQLKKFNEKLKGVNRKESGRQRAAKEAGGLMMAPPDDIEPSYQDIVDETGGTTDARNAPAADDEK